jgi:hypothetical protein
MQATMKSMNTKEANLIPPELQDDTQALMDSLATGKPLDPAVARSIRERAEHIRQEIFDEHGILDIGVPAIRELRDRDDE